MKFSRDQFEVESYLGSIVAKAKDNRVLKETACMSDGNAKLYGFLVAIEEIDKDYPCLTTQIKKDIAMAKRILVALGQSQYKRDPITNLAMRAPRDVKRDHATV